MEINKIYDFSYNYLLKLSSTMLTREEIDSFISNSDVINCNSLSDVFELLLSILQNFQGYKNFINYKKREKEIKEAIKFPNIDYCSKLDYRELANYFIKKYNATNKCWERYCKGIISGARFLCSFDDYTEFKKICDNFDNNDMAREAFALFIKDKIFNMGFALACDWLKELGYKNYAKPDTHIKDICCAFGLIEEGKNDVEYFEVMCNISKKCNVNNYSLDKVWWLICSGDFYRYNVKIGNPDKNKSNFIKAIKEDGYYDKI